MQTTIKQELESDKKEHLNQVQNTLAGIPQIQLSYKTGGVVNTYAKLSCPSDCADAFRASWDDDKIEFIEQFKIMLLNRANNILGIFEVSTGGITGTVVDIKLVLSAALLSCASGIILGHNHPSGSLNPSSADILATKKMKEAASLLEIAVLDHIILTKDGFYSFAEEGAL